MVCVPTDKLEVLKLAVVVPPVVLSVPWPILVVPSENVTMPVGLATAVLPGLPTDTVAVNVTVCPDAEGFTEDKIGRASCRERAASGKGAALCEKLPTPA